MVLDLAPSLALVLVLHLALAFVRAFVPALALDLAPASVLALVLAFVLALVFVLAFVFVPLLLVLILMALLLILRVTAQWLWFVQPGNVSELTARIWNVGVAVLRADRTQLASVPPCVVTTWVNRLVVPLWQSVSVPLLVESFRGETFCRVSSELVKVTTVGAWTLARRTPLHLSTDTGRWLAALVSPRRLVQVTWSVLVVRWGRVWCTPMCRARMTRTLGPLRSVRVTPLSEVHRLDAKMHRSGLTPTHLRPLPPFDRNEKGVAMIPSSMPLTVPSMTPWQENLGELRSFPIGRLTPMRFPPLPRIHSFSPSGTPTLVPTLSCPPLIPGLNTLRRPALLRQWPWTMPRSWNARPFPASGQVAQRL